MVDFTEFKNTDLMKMVNTLTCPEKEHLAEILLKDIAKTKGTKGINTILSKGILTFDKGVFGYPVYAFKVKDLKQAPFNRNKKNDVVERMKRTFQKQVIDDNRKNKKIGIGYVYTIPLLGCYDPDTGDVIILDGNHRLEAFKSIDENMTVYVSIYNPDGRKVSIEEMKTILIETSRLKCNWTQKNVDEAYANSGNQNYTKLNQFVSEATSRGLSESNAKALMCGYYRNDANGIVKEIFSSGMFLFSEDRYAYAEKAIKDLEPVVKAIDYAAHKTPKTPNFEVGNKKSKFVSVAFNLYEIYPTINIKHLAAMIENRMEPEDFKRDFNDRFNFLVSLYNNRLPLNKQLNYTEAKNVLNKFNRTARDKYNMMKAQYVAEHADLLKTIRKNNR